jgi:Arc/MetJ-type ribon-helix-helix transcriptional regulator
MALIVVALHRCLLERPVHSFDLAIRPGMVRLGQAVLDAVPVAWGRPELGLLLPGDAGAVSQKEAIFPSRAKPLEHHPMDIHIPSKEMENAMAAEIHRLRDKAGETEKITINLGYVDLGHIDLLVQEGFYSNRTDFIRTAIRNQLSTHGEEVRKSIVRHTLELGLRHYTSADLEAVKAAGEKLHIKVLGLASIAPDVTPALALATIESITVLGALHASKEIKSALADRIG